MLAEHLSRAMAVQESRAKMIRGLISTADRYEAHCSRSSGRMAIAMRLIVAGLLVAPVSTFAPSSLAPVRANAGSCALRLHSQSLAFRSPANPSPSIRRMSENGVRRGCGGTCRVTCSSTDVPVYGAETTGTWEWRGHSIRYGSAGESSSSAPVIVMVHGFGSSADTWRKQYKEYGAAGYRVFGIGTPLQP